MHGGLTEAFAIAMGQEIAYDEIGNVKGASFMDLLPADRGRDAALGDGFHRHAVAASSDRRERCRREPERRRRSGVQQRGQRCVRLPRQHAHPDAARRLAAVAGGTKAGSIGTWVAPLPVSDFSPSPCGRGLGGGGPAGAGAAPSRQPPPARGGGGRLSIRSRPMAPSGTPCQRA